MGHTVVSYHWVHMEQHESHIRPSVMDRQDGLARCSLPHLSILIAWRAHAPSQDLLAGRTLAPCNPLEGRTWSPEEIRGLSNPHHLFFCLCLCLFLFCEIRLSFRLVRLVRLRSRRHLVEDISHTLKGERLMVLLAHSSLGYRRRVHVSRIGIHRALCIFLPRVGRVARIRVHRALCIFLPRVGRVSRV